LVLEKYRKTRRSYQLFRIDRMRIHGGGVKGNALYDKLNITRGLGKQSGASVLGVLKGDTFGAGLIRAGSIFIR
jgi:hypothetical protein